ncbi:MAG: 6-phosphofructokinase [Proteobacteria bacterium]|jgi:6-phosphofructokinase 1|nr:6-phosphofructokinase [Pseudomonadota bacterium]
MLKNAIYAQSGGVTSVINASAFGVINACRDMKDRIGTLYAAYNGILGILHEDLIDTANESDADIKALRYTPGGAFGSCRYKLESLEKNRKEYERLIEVFSAYNIEYFFYNGGNDSADTCLKVSLIANELGYPIKAIHIPKTIDNDLVITDNCPGFGSVAKYVATSIKEAGFDLASMCATSTKVFIMEVMGRNAGWIAASSALASTDSSMPPHIILFPELVFDEGKFLSIVEQTVKSYGYCVIVTSEGIKNNAGELLSASGISDAFGHAQLGGVASLLAEMVHKKLKYKCHYAIADYLQRSARHIAARVDVEQAIAVGDAGVKLALSGHNAIMPYIKRVTQEPYSWIIDYAKLEDVANYERFMPRSFINKNGFHITEECRNYLAPLIQGEDHPPYIDGLPNYIKLKNVKVNKKLPAFTSTS